MTHQAITRYNYHKWANSVVLDHLEQLPAGVYERQIESVFSSLSEVIAHIYQTDGLWLSVMSGDTMAQTFEVIEEIQKTLSDKNLDHIKPLFSELSQRYDTFLTRQENLDRQITTEHPTYGKQQFALSSLVEHVVNHGTYHRGNITAMLRQQGHTGVATDYVLYMQTKSKNQTPKQ